MISYISNEAGREICCEAVGQSDHYLLGNFTRYRYLAELQRKFGAIWICCLLQPL